MNQLQIFNNPECCNEYSLDSKGRLAIHHILTERGIRANMDKAAE